MKWVTIALALFIIISGWRLFSALKPPGVTRPKEHQNNKHEDILPQPVNTISSSIFIPYWNIPNLSDDLSTYDTLIYFGVAPGRDGKLKDDLGFKNIESFISNTNSTHERLLSVRMLDDEGNLRVLQSESIKSKVISQSITLAQKYGFDGIVLDLELGVIPFENTKDAITSFVKLFSEATHNGIIPQRRDNPDNTKPVTFSLTLYGDMFYRARPYDVAALANYVDTIYIMAYDFHKSRGEPGPNFPFDRQSLVDGDLENEYGYDFQKMVDDFTSVVPREKITVLFGMYGYDWTLGPQGKPLKAAKAIPLNEIENGYSDCQISVIPDLIRNPEKVTGSPIGVGDDMCINYINPTSAEKHILYTDDEGYKHELWYEDEESANVKIDYLKSQGIGNVGYWVWGYF